MIQIIFMIIVVPERLTLESVIQNVNLDKNKTTIPIGFNINDLNYIDIDIADTTNFTIVGKERSGKTNFIKMIIEVLNSIADAMQSADEDIASKISMQ